MIGGKGIYLFLVGTGSGKYVWEAFLVFMVGGCVCSVLLISLLERYFVTMDQCIVLVLVLKSAMVMVSGFVLMFVV